MGERSWGRKSWILRPLLGSVARITAIAAFVAITAGAPRAGHDGGGGSRPMLRGCVKR
ncbi:putative secreted protein [Sorangium cellulosum So ce56]|uniref:Secreted protein n=1 Tax=Sorangium cellulosum (strain So ce56) TaxID=448385 RepID=A9GE14_SORC5|nr:putative secreted protein [Sorangium cellulosum So ce56]